MADYQEKYPLDYRIGGDTVDDFAQKYMKEIPRIYQFLNNVRGLNSEGSEQVDPTKYQLKAEDDKLYIRNKENTDWIYLGKIAECFGFTSSADNAFLTENDIATRVNEANKLLRTNASGLLDASITGNAAKIAEKIIETDGLSDGDILVYRVSSGKFVNESKGTIGAGKELIFQANGDTLGTYSGDAQTTINIPGISVLQRNKSYEVGDIAYSAKLPSYLRLECVTAGTTGASEPDFESNKEAGQYATDGTSVFILDDIRDGNRVGDIVFRPVLHDGYIKANGATVTASEYPRLLKFAQDNNLLVDSIAWNSDKSKYVYTSGTDTLKIPDAQGRVLQGTADTVKSIEAGLPALGKSDNDHSIDITFFGPTPMIRPPFVKRWSENAKVNSDGTTTISNYACDFDAMADNPMYGASDTVQPPALALIPQIKY